MRHVYSVDQQQMTQTINATIHVVDYYKKVDEGIVFVRSRIYKDDCALGFIRYDYGHYSSQLVDTVDYNTVLAQFKSLFNIINQQ